MTVWKQLALALVILAVAGAGWLYLFPGGKNLLSKVGIDRNEQQPPSLPEAVRDNGRAGRRCRWSSSVPQEKPRSMTG